MLAHENDLMVIKVQNPYWSVKCVLIDPCNFANIFYWDTFKGINMDTSEMLPFKGTLVGFSEEQVQVLGNLPILVVFGSGDNVKCIKVRYLIVYASSPYNIIIGRLVFNTLEVALSIIYLTLKYPLGNGRVGVIKVN